MNDPRRFWYFCLNGKQEPNLGVFTTVYAYGENIGQALNYATQVVIGEGVINPKPIEICRLDDLEGFELPTECIQVNSNVYIHSEFQTYEINENEYDFIPPAGIVFGSDEHKYETDLIQERFVAYSKNEEDIYEFELVVDDSRLNTTFLKAITFLPSIDGFWMYLLEHWNNEKTELYINKHYSNLNAVINFLQENEEETVKNGSIEIVVHSAKGETNLTLNEHKKIQFTTKDETQFNEFIGQIMELGFEQTKDYYSIELGYHHWHYQTQKCKDRTNFVEHLVNNNFVLVPED
jgi:hypothetical protein